MILGGFMARKFKYDRIGETKIMSNGLSAKIIRYGRTDDIDIEFENGGIALNKEYYAFERGKIACPMIFESYGRYVKCVNPNTLNKTEFLIDEDDYDKIKGVWWSKTPAGYITNPRKRISVHRIILNCSHGEIIDHINGDPTDNRKENLRICNTAQNGWNRGIPKNNTSGFKGITYKNEKNRKCRWAANIKVNGSTYFLGHYSKREHAAEAYKVASIKYHGEFSKAV